MATEPKVTVHVDEHGAVRVEVAGQAELAEDDLVAEKPSEPVAAFGDEEFKARQHIRWSGG
ncbi:MAG TPA: hypothetical protein VHF24_00620 [Acidimicrobiales bacterium]|nr:hypothetical protein [Acidimicrobiales bacterium]